MHWNPTGFSWLNFQSTAGRCHTRKNLLKKNCIWQLSHWSELALQFCMKAVEEGHIESGVPAPKEAKSKRHSKEGRHSHCLQNLFYKHEHDRKNSNHAFNQNSSVLLSVLTNQQNEYDIQGTSSTSMQVFLGFCVYKQMLRWLPTFQVATTCFSCTPPPT